MGEIERGGGGLKRYRQRGRERESRIWSGFLNFDSFD